MFCVSLQVLGYEHLVKLPTRVMWYSESLIHHNIYTTNSSKKGCHQTVCGDMSDHFHVYTSVRFGNKQCPRKKSENRKELKAHIKQNATTLLFHASINCTRVEDIVSHLTNLNNLTLDKLKKKIKKKKHYN